MSSRAKLFVYLNAFLDFQRIWPRFVQTITSSRQKKKKEKKRGAGFSFGPLLQDVLSPFFQDGRPENDITHTSIRKKKTRISTGREEAEKFQLFPD